MDPRDKREDESWAEYGARMATMGVAPQSWPGDSLFNLGSPTGVPSHAVNMGDYTNIYHATDNLEALKNAGFNRPNPVFMTTNPQVAQEAISRVPHSPALLEAQINTKNLSGALETVPGPRAGGVGETQGLMTPAQAEKAFLQGSTDASAIQRAKIGPVDLGVNTNTMADMMPSTNLDAVKSIAGKAARFAPGLNVALGGKAVYDRLQADQPVRAALAAGSMLPGVGPAFLGAEMLADAVADPIQMRDYYHDLGMGGGGMPFEGERLGTRAGPDLPQSYDLSAQTPGLAGTQTGMPVAVDAGGAVGGYPTMDTDYGTMATEESDYVPSVSGDAGITDIPDLAMTRFERSKLQLPQGPFTPLPDFKPSAFTPYGPTRQVPARIRQTIPTANDPTGGLSATDPNLQDLTPFSMVNATGNLAGYGASPISMVKHQMGLDVEQPATKYGDPYWDSDSSVQMLVDEDAAIDYDFSAIAPVELDEYGKYKSDTGWHHGDWKGTDSRDFRNWQLERLPTFTTMTPTMERVREQEAVAAGNIASETAGGLDKIARERIANQAAIERKMDEDAARINRERKAAEKALEDAQNLARKQENARLNAVKREIIQERIQEEANAAIERVSQAQALMSKYGGRREPAENYMSAAERDIVAAAQVDTFANMGAEGPMSAAEINVAGGMEFGGAGGMAGSGRGSSGRGGPGGRGR